MKPLLHTDIYKMFGGYKLEVPIEIPDQKFGDWEIRTFTVTKEDEDRQKTRMLFQMGKMGSMRMTPAGTYKKLLRKDGTVVMSNTPDELKDQVDFLRHAHGNVLINGLGLGITLKMLRTVNRTDSVTIIEIDKDIIKTVGEYYLKEYGDWLTIIHADARIYKPKKDEYYNAVWHDIWDDIHTNNLELMKTLTRKYARKTDWQACWCRELVEKMRDSDRI